MSTSTPSASDAPLKIWSCVVCRRRKVRCDRRDPCANCTKAGIECHYPVTGRVPRRRADPATWTSPAQKQSELLSRLRRLEAVVTELAGQVEDGPGAPLITPATTRDVQAVTPVTARDVTAVSGSTSSPDTAQSDASVVQSVSSGSDALSKPPGSEFDEEFGRLVVGKDGGLHVGNRFWSVFCDEVSCPLSSGNMFLCPQVDHIFEAMHDVADSVEQGPSSASEAPSSGTRSSQSFVFGDSAGSLDSLNPLPSQMLFIWQTYVDNIDPFLKILHVPSMEKAIRELKGRPFSSLSPNMESLLFAVCLAAIMSIDDESVMLNFATPKPQLLSRYRLGTEQALGRANFLVTKDLVVVQAFVVYLTVLFYLGANDLAWPLIGSLLRVAKGLQLHRKDGARNCSPLEAELRRRVWWHVCFLDSKAQKPGTRDLSLSGASFDVELPFIVDDADLDPEATSTIPVAARRLSTRMVPCLVRCELWRLVHSLQDHSAESLQVKLHIYNDVKSRVTASYLSRIGLGPLEAYIRSMCSLFFAKADLVNHKSSALPTSQASLQATLKASITIIADVHSLLTNPDWTQWRWQLAGHVPWHAIGIFLSQACRQPWGPESEQVWVKTKRLLDAAPGEAKEDRLWGPLMRLMADTERHRATHLGDEALVEGEVHFMDTHQQIVGLSYPTDQLSHLAIQGHANHDHPELGANGNANNHNNELLITAEYSEANFYAPVDPPLWSPTAELDGPGHPASAMTVTEPDLSQEVIPMDWESWDRTLAMESIWNLF